MTKRAIRINPLLFVVLALIISGCGDCVKDIIENNIPDPNNFRPDLPPNNRNNQPDGGNEDTGRTPKDVNFTFDFGGPDQGNAAFALTGVIPDFGPVTGGNQVRIDGSGFQDGSRVLFGGKDMEVELASGYLVGRVPPGSGPGLVTVKVIAPNGEIRALVDAYRYVEDLRIDSVSPNLVPSKGGSEVEIRGAGFTDPIGVSFSGDDALNVTYVSPELIRVITPARPRGFADVRVTTISEATELERGVEYFDEVEIERVEPASGLVAGGDTVTIYGTGFNNGAVVRFDNSEATVVSVDQAAGTITVQTPPHPVGLVNVFVETNKSAGVLENGFYYRLNDNPILAAIVPNEGPESGGNGARVIGYGFDTGGAAILIGANNAPLSNVNPSYADILVPAGTLGSQDVIYNIGAEINRLVAGYTYLDDLTLTAINPTTGPSSGGTSVVFTGDGFTNANAVQFDGVPVEFTIDSDTQITATTRSHPGGVVDVSVHRGSLEARLPDAFTFDEELEIWGFTPQRGAVAGDTYVEVRGRGFFGQLGVTLDGVPSEQVQRVDRNNLTLRTPPNPPGDAVLSVSAGNKTAVGPYPFLYFDPASRFGGASGGPVDGSVNVTVFSFGAGPIENAFVMLSTRADTPYQGFTDANGQITLSGPDVIGAQTTTATAAGFSTATIQTVDSENITLFLNELDPMPGQGSGNPPPEGKIFGTIKATGKLANPDDSNTYDQSIVVTTAQTLSGAGNPPPGNNSVVIGTGNYEIRTRVGDMAVIGLCGTFHQPTGTFTPLLMAIERFVFVGDKDELEIDLVCDIPLDQTHEYKLVNAQFAPTGPDNNRVRTFWDFGFEGVLPSRTIGTGLSNIIQVTNQPKPEGVIADMRFTAIGGSYTGATAPLSQSTLTDIDDPTAMIELPTLLDVPAPITPLAGGIVENRIISFHGGAPFTPDFHILILRNEIGIPVWQFMLPGHETVALLPTFPDFSGLPPDIRPVPLQQGPLTLTVISARLRAGHIYEEFSYRDIDADLWETYSLNSWSIRLPVE